jgi:DNA-binding response OmpR family regulator
MRILAVGSNQELQQALKFLFEMNGFTPHLAASAGEVISLLGQQPFDIVLIDLNVGKEAGDAILAFLDGMKGTPPEVVVSMTDHLGEEQLGRIRSLARRVLFKPVPFADLLEEIQLHCIPK